MHIISIEPTPSPNSMKVNLSERLPDGVRHTYTIAEQHRAPGFIRDILAVNGVKSVYHAADFIAVDRLSKADWQPILQQIRELLSSGGAAQTAAPGGGSGGTPSAGEAGAFGEVHVLLQHFRGIPLQIRVQSGTEQQRAALPERFSEAAVRAASASPNLIKERSLEDWGVRYGELKEVLEEVAQELDATYDDARLEQLVQQAQQQAGPAASGAAAVQAAGRTVLAPEELARELTDADWKRRYAALQQVKPSQETLPLLVQALRDEKSTIRRLATVYLGDLKDQADVLPYLYQALQDESASVRRTAGDTLSDIGDPRATQAMAKALKDPNKLVRWRAARFLYEAGTNDALPALKEALTEPEFEVLMQLQMAVERMEGGQTAEGSVWQQMTRRSQQP